MDAGAVEVRIGMLYSYGTRKLLTCIHKVNWLKGRYMEDLGGRGIMIFKMSLKQISSGDVYWDCLVQFGFIDSCSHQILLEDNLLDLQILVT